MTDTLELSAIANRLRAHSIRMVHQANASHIGSCLSMAEIIACLYWRTLAIDPQRPHWAGRDRFILSKGHAAALLYAALAERGFISVNDLKSYCQDGSRLTGHANSRVPGVELSTGSLGHGLPVGCGIALAAKRDGLTHRVFVLLSDGELDEGSNWEAILFAPHHRLDNLQVIVDYNKIQSFGRVDDVLNLEPLADKFQAFGWSVREVDGHDTQQLADALEAITEEKPSAVIAHTTKGRGVSFMEDQLAWHYKSPTAEQAAAALAELLCANPR